MNNLQLWERYKENLCCCPEIGLTLDISRMKHSDAFLDEMEPKIQQAYKEMADLEKGAVANPDEQRMVGHYWLRNPSLAPDQQLSSEITFTVRAVQEFAQHIHDGTLTAPGGKKFRRMLIIGIGGSALGPQFVAEALGTATDPVKPLFFDNTDPDGMDRVLRELGRDLAETLTIVISKSGGTKETRNGMLEAKRAYEAAGLDFSQHTVAITGKGSELDATAVNEKWLARFPMWDWVGGRTSETSVVGLLPAAIQGFDIAAFLDGARMCDEVTRRTTTRSNPAALLALMWYWGTGGQGRRDMVILPYKDRLLLFSRYLQQLIMESIGKEKDREGNTVNQGITVYGNKGSTDQHAYVQQLREGVANFFVTFIEVLKDRQEKSMEVEPDVTSGDYLSGFFQGTRKALYDNGRESITITIDQVDARTVGVLVALYERAVGLYASLVNINAYHQPGVEAGKKAAGEVLRLQREILGCLRSRRQHMSAEEIAHNIGAPEEVETVFRILLHLSANDAQGVTYKENGNIFSRMFYSAQQD